MLQSGDHQNIHKGGPKKKTCEMKNEENEIQTDSNEILKICARFYTELYGSTLQDQHPSLENTSPDSSEVPPIMTSEVKNQENTERNKKQGPGIDKMTSDVMILGGEEPVKQFFKNLISRDKKDTS